MIRIWKVITSKDDIFRRFKKGEIKEFFLQTDDKLFTIDSNGIHPIEKSPKTGILLRDQKPQMLNFYNTDIELIEHLQLNSTDEYLRLEDIDGEIDETALLIYEEYKDKLADLSML